MRKVLENCSLSDEERMDALESQLKETRFLAEEADRKYDEVARNLAVVQDDLEHAETGQSWRARSSCWKMTSSGPSSAHRPDRLRSWS
ncbi:tropomyosin-like isoform X3 [Amphibalanus amphitrite]|uniref:tropomyosin-like isoform X3 n=1 Tax=Amphibalanus amphitrite TaxID=1232801 RepID=UPI001C928882|nr:tropomyosin-like isoform X3 [Amphibalanus amphitrite]